MQFITFSYCFRFQVEILHSHFKLISCACVCLFRGWGRSMCTCVHMHGETRGQTQVSFLMNSIHQLFSQAGPLTGLELPGYTKLVG